MTIETEGFDEAGRFLDAVVERFSEPPRELLAEWAERLRNDVLPSNLQTIKFPPLAEATRRIRAHRYGAARAAGPILIRNRFLVNSVQVLRLSDDSVEVGPTASFANEVEFGSVTPSDSKIPGKKVPARPWVVFQPSEIEKVFQDAERHYFTVLDGNS